MADSRSLPPAEEVSVVTDDLGINEDEREEIEREIDALVAEGGRESTLQPEFLNPRRSGFGLPVVIWLLAGTAFTAGFLFIHNYFQVREETITIESRTYFSAEASLIDEILRDSEQRLAAKDQEIFQIQDRLARLDAEKLNLEENLENEVAAREAELRSQLAMELAAERARLAEAGRSDEEIAARLAELRVEREADVASQLDAFRAEAQAELAVLQQQLEAQEAQLQQTLAASQEERVRLADEAARRESELRARFTEEIAELEQAEQTALARIDDLQRAREQEQLLTDRVLGSFTIIVQDIEGGLSDEALSGLSSLERLLLDEGRGTSDRQQRRRTELALVSTLRGLVQEVDVLRQNIAVRDLTTTDEETSQIERERAAELIRSAADTIVLAENARQAGRFTEARSLYQQALATIPSLERVYPAILDMESTRRRIALQSAVTEAQSLLAAGSSQLAVERYLESIRTIAADQDDPLVQVAAGIDAAVRRTRLDLLDSWDGVEQEFRQQIADRDAQITRLTQNLASAQNSVSTGTTTAESLRAQLAGLRAELESTRAALTERDARLAGVRREVTSLQDEIATARTDLAAERSRSTSLQQSLEQSLADANAARMSLQGQVASLQQELAERPDVATESRSSVIETPAAAQAEIDGLGREIAAREARIVELETSLETSRSELSSARSSAEALRADVEEAATRIAGLEQRIATLQESREVTTGEAEQLQQELIAARRRVAELERLEQSVNTLTARYASALGSAQARLEAGAYDQARNQILIPFGTSEARELFPGFATTITSAHRGLIAEAQATTTGEAREATLGEIIGLATEVQKNIQEPRESFSVQSYLRRHPDLLGVADGIFEIVELAARAISAPEIEYRLLGSVSRVTGNLVVVERLVALEAAVGDTIEVRRTPTLGQEIPVASGTILEVTDRRVVVSVDSVYELEIQPATRDLIYLAQE